MSKPYLDQVAAREEKARADSRKGCAAMVVLACAVVWGVRVFVVERRSPGAQAAAAREQLRYSAQTQAIRRVQGRARDPESVQTRNLVTAVKDSTWVVCGEYNAKNAFGGYVGFQGFAVSSKGEFATAEQNSEAYALMLRVCLQ